MMKDEVKESLTSKVTVLIYKHHKRIEKLNLLDILNDHYL